MKLISRLTSCLNLPLTMLLVLAVLLSKFYFLWGFQLHTHLPAANISLVLVRDLILFSFYGYLIYKIKWKNVKIDLLGKLVVGLLLWGLAIACIHLSYGKAIEEIAQHYFRNLLIPILSFPLFYWFLETNSDEKSKIADHLHSVMIAFGVINLIFCYLQIFMFPHLMWETRPTGILGDPLINSCFLLIMLWALFKTENSPATKIFMIFITGFILFSGSSISAITAFLIAVFFTTLKSARYAGAGKLFTKRNLIGFFLLGCLVAILFSNLHRQLKLSYGVTEKIESFWNSMSCTENCEIDPSIKGRIISYKFTINMCKNDSRACLLGDIFSNKYFKLDSTIASIIANCGVIFGLLYSGLFFLLPMLKIERRTIMKYNLDLLFGVYVLFWAFGLFNTSIYKYPLNILFYLCLATMFSLGNDKKSQ